MPGDRMNAFSDWLAERAAHIRRMEQEALRRLEQGDEAAYRRLMRQKAELLAALPKDALPLLREMEPGARSAALDRLMAFARGAANALSLNSVFYMSALLYPEAHREGEPNDLEAFIASLRGA